MIIYAGDARDVVKRVRGNHCSGNVEAFLADPLNLPLLLSLVAYLVLIFPTELFKLTLPGWSGRLPFETLRNLSLALSFTFYTAVFYLALSLRARRRGGA